MFVFTFCEYDDKVNDPLVVVLWTLNYEKSWRSEVR